MTLSIRTAAVTLLIALTGSIAVAQENADMAALNAAIETQRQVTEAQRQMIVNQNLSLTAAESEKFWPLYREYRADVAKLNDRFVNVVQEYAKRYESLSDKDALALLKEAQKIDGDRIKLYKKYTGKFSRILPGTKVARYMQIETRLDAVMELKARNSIPLVM